MENELFEKAPVAKAYFKFALPVVFGMVVGLVYNMVDTFFIARTGNTNLIAGVALSAPIFTLMIALGDICGLGGSSVISRLFGQKLYEDGKRIGAFCFITSILGGLLVTALLLILRQPILQLLGAKEDTLTYASQYYTWIAIGAPFIIFSFSPNNILRTEGLANESMIGSVIGSIANIILDPIFISVLGLGAAGAAIATVIGNIVTDLYFVWVLQKKSKRLTLNPRGLHISRSEILDILAIGIPASITNLMQSIGITLNNRFLLPYGTEKVAALGIVMKINLIAVLILVGFAFGGQPLIGYNYGAKNKQRLKEIFRFAYGFECSLAAVLAIVLSLAAPAFLRFFVSEEAIISTGVVMLRFLMSSMIFIAVILISTATFQSTGKAIGAFLLSVSRQGAIYAVVLVLASRIAGYYGVLASQAVSDILTGLLAVVLFTKLLLRELK